MDEEVKANAEIVKKNQDNLIRIIWWINKAISFIRPYVGLCIRWVFINNDKERDYYQPGKIFKYRNITSSVKFNPEENESIEKFRRDHHNFCFHIFSKAGVITDTFQTHDRRDGTVLFRAGSEFMVCKREERDGITHIYIREVQLGFGQNVLFWLDHNVFKQDDECQQWIRYANYHCLRKDVKFILKSYTCTTLAYFKSIFFKISIQNINDAMSYKLIQNRTRFNEEL